MKKLLAVLASVLLICSAAFAASACKDEVTPPGDDGQETTSGSDSPATPFDGNVLIAYFSWSGTTTRLAQHVQSRLPEATAYRIERATPYSNDYNEVAYGEAKDEADGNARPPVKNPLSAEQMSGYDSIIVMYPIWWHTAPMVVGTFLETYDLSGVDIYPITQSASMSVSQFNESFAFVKNCAGNATVHSGLGTKNTGEIDDYLRANGLLA